MDKNIEIKKNNFEYQQFLGIKSRLLGGSNQAIEKKRSTD
jgi:hypothetical protein